MPSHLGIDVGTTSIKVCVVKDGVKVRSFKAVHNADTTPNGIHPSSHLFHEQNPRIILESLDECMNQVSILSANISQILVTGQMHGVILWKRALNKNIEEKHVVSIFDALVAVSTNLITWQDQRCGKTFLDSFPPSPPFCKISTGFGIATLAWLQKEFKNLDKYDMCGTIMDFIVWLLTETNYVTMTPHNANSWGYFDIAKGCWETDKLQQLGLDSKLIPNIVAIDTPVGRLKWPLYNISTDAVVYASLGDMQCSICASKPFKNEAVIHIGTSSQLSFITKYDNKRMIEVMKKYPAVSIVPYKDDYVIISAASLSGGNTINNFASNIQSWMTELGCMNVPVKKDLYKKLELSASIYKQSREGETRHLQIVPRIFGERYAPNLFASVTNINSSNCSLGSITLALYEGIISNLCTMIPVKLLKQHGAQGVVATGGALVDNGVLIELVTDMLELPLRVAHDDDGSYGAAIFSEDYSSSNI